MRRQHRITRVACLTSWHCNRTQAAWNCALSGATLWHAARCAPLHKAVNTRGTTHAYRGAPAVLERVLDDQHGGQLGQEGVLAEGHGARGCHPPAGAPRALVVLPVPLHDAHGCTASRARVTRTHAPLSVTHRLFALLHVLLSGGSADTVTQPDGLVHVHKPCPACTLTGCQPVCECELSA